MNFRTFVALLCLTIGIGAKLGVQVDSTGIKFPPLPWVTISQPTAVVYVYEKDQGSIPPHVQAALNKLNRERGILATAFEQDTVDGTGQVPDQYKAPLAAARSVGLPALVVTQGATVVRTIKSPATEAAIMEAIR